MSKMDQGVGSAAMWKGHAVKAKPITMIWFGILALGILQMLAGCSRAIEPESQPPAGQKEIVMPTESQMRQARAAVPVIDAEAPPTFDTATFGLG